MMRVPPTVVVEGDTDAAVVSRIFEAIKLPPPAKIIDCGGKGRLDAKLGAYAAAAKHAPWLVLRDLDWDAPCPAALLDDLLPAGAKELCVRIAVRSIESWLLADRERFARFLDVPVGSLPKEPDLLDHPKQTVVGLARRSTRGLIRDGMVPRPGSKRRVGPLYEALLIEFAQERWRPKVARGASESLDRCFRAVRRATRREWRRWC